jgi:hypothetical protein
MSVSPSAWKNMSPAAWIFVKFCMGLFIKSLNETQNLKREKKKGTLYEDPCEFLIFAAEFSLC